MLTLPVGACPNPLAIASFHSCSSTLRGSGFLRWLSAWDELVVREMGRGKFSRSYVSLRCLTSLGDTDAGKRGAPSWIGGSRERGGDVGGDDAGLGEDDAETDGEG